MKDNFEIKQELLEQICDSDLPKEQQVTAMQTVFLAYDEHREKTGSLAMEQDNYFKKMEERKNYIKEKLYSKFPELRK